MKPNIQLKNLFLPSLFILMSVCTTANAQMAESFELANAPSDTTPPGWSQQSFSANYGTFPNGFKRAGAGSIQSIGSFPAATAFSGNNMIKFNNRTVVYPALSGAPNGDAAILISRPLDWSGKSGGGAGTISMRFYRDNSLNNGVDLINDRIEVYLNNQPNLTGAQVLTDVTTAAITIPRSTTLLPTAAAGWQ